jgi:hypothetical protein
MRLIVAKHRQRHRTRSMQMEYATIGMHLRCYLLQSIVTNGIENTICRWKVI